MAILIKQVYVKLCWLRKLNDIQNKEKSSNGGKQVTLITTCNGIFHKLVLSAIFIKIL